MKINIKKVIVHILVITFGTGTWLGNSAIIIQAPILVNSAPEGMFLPSHIDIVTQIAVVGPLLYTLYQNYARKKCKDSHMIYFIYTLGIFGCLAGIFYIRTTYSYNGIDRSLPFYFITFILGIVGQTSASLFIPYMGRFLETYMLSYIMGESLSGLWPSLLGFIQGVGGDAICIQINSTDDGPPIFKRIVPPPHFTPETYFIFMLIIQAFGLISYVLLQKWSYCRSEYSTQVQVTADDSYQYNQNEKSPNEGTEILSHRIYFLLLGIMFVICFLPMGVASTLSNYAYEPYGDDTYHLAISLSMTSCTISSVFAILLHNKSLKTIFIWTVISIVVAVYCLVVTFTYSNPPFVHATLGRVLIIFCGAVRPGIPNYVRICILTQMRAQGAKSLVWAGTIYQIGISLGICVAFSLINFTDLINTMNPICL